MKWLKPVLPCLLAVCVVATGTMAPTQAMAQNSHAYKHRQKTKNEWRNLAIGAGALGILGLLRHDSALAFLGVAGALYSADRYEKDRKSQSKMRRARASVFSRGSFTRNGHRYVRRTVYRKGHKYYRFVRVS